jgi:DNA-binding XRE family transcriptional regulator
MKSRNGLPLSRDFVARQLKVNRASIVQIEAGKHNNNVCQMFSDLYEIDQNQIIGIIEYKKVPKEHRKTSGYC